MRNQKINCDTQVWFNSWKNGKQTAKLTCRKLKSGIEPITVIMEKSQNRIQVREDEMLRAITNINKFTIYVRIFSIQIVM